MYYYLYDSHLSEKKYNNVIARVETRLTDLGINGKINRLSFLKNINQVISEEIKRGVKTIVVVGNDKTIGQVINLIGDLNITIGIIPIGSNNNIARLLGIPQGEEACDILSSRIINKLDVGSVNGYLFLTSLEIGGRNITLNFDDNFLINLSDGDNVLNVSNLNNYNGAHTDPMDGKLDVFVETSKKHFLKRNELSKSRLVGKNIRIIGTKTLPIFLSDEKKIVKTPAEITIIPKKLKIIVGKLRYF